MGHFGTRHFGTINMVPKCPDSSGIQKCLKTFRDYMPEMSDSFAVNYAGHFSFCCVLLRCATKRHISRTRVSSIPAVWEGRYNPTFCWQTSSLTTSWQIKTSSRLIRLFADGFYLSRWSRKRAGDVVVILVKLVGTKPKLTLLNSLKWHSFSNRMMWTIVHGTSPTWQIREIVVVFSDFSELKHSRAYPEIWPVGREVVGSRPLPFDPLEVDPLNAAMGSGGAL